MPVQGVGGGPIKGPRPEDTSEPKGVSGNFERKPTTMEQLRKIFEKLKSEHPPSAETMFALGIALQAAINDPSINDNLKSKLKDDAALLKEALTEGIDTEKFFQAIKALQDHLTLLK